MENLLGTGTFPVCVFCGVWGWLINQCSCWQYCYSPAGSQTVSVENVWKVRRDTRAKQRLKSRSKGNSPCLNKGHIFKTKVYLCKSISYPKCMVMHSLDLDCQHEADSLKNQTLRSHLHWLQGTLFCFSDNVGHVCVNPMKGSLSPGLSPRHLSCHSGRRSASRDMLTWSNNHCCCERRSLGTFVLVNTLYYYNLQPERLPARSDN